MVALTGAGISAESGIPTFRGAGGLWRSFRPEELATPGAFRRNPDLVWEWYEWRRGVIAAAQPNAGHFALVELERTKHAFTMATQNVDGLHDLAGSRRIVKLHGDIWIDRCLACGRELVREHAKDTYQHHSEHRCGCGGLLRPGLVWFGEPLPENALSSAEDAVRGADLVLVIGTSAAVYPAAGLVPLARQSGARVIEVNLEETTLSAEVDVSLRGKSGDILPKLIA